MPVTLPLPCYFGRTQLLAHHNLEERRRRPTTGAPERWLPLFNLSRICAGALRSCLPGNIACHPRCNGFFPCLHKHTRCIYADVQRRFTDALFTLRCRACYRWHTLSSTAELVDAIVPSAPIPPGLARKRQHRPPCAFRPDPPLDHTATLLTFEGRVLGRHCRWCLPASMSIVLNCCCA